MGASDSKSKNIQPPNQQKPLEKSLVDEEWPRNFEKLIWCTPDNNTVSIYDVNTQKRFTYFQGTESPIFTPSRNTIRTIWWVMLLVETNILLIPNTNLLISTGYYKVGGALEFFDISKRSPKQIYTFSDNWSHMTSTDIAYCDKRNLFAIFPTKDSLPYHLFEIQYGAEGVTCSLVKKAKRGKPYTRNYFSNTEILLILVCRLSDPWFK